MTDHATGSYDEIYAEVSDWLQRNWDPSSGLEAWRECLVEGGWAAHQALIVEHQYFAGLQLELDHANACVA